MMKYNIEIEIYVADSHLAHNSWLTFDWLFGKSKYPIVIRGTYSGDLGKLRSQLVERIEESTHSFHDTEFRLVDTKINVRVNIYHPGYNVEEFIARLSEFIHLDDRGEKNLEVKLTDLQEVMYFSDNTNEHDVTGEDYLEFVDKFSEKVKVIYNYNGTETGAGHFYDTLIIFGSGITVNLISTEIYRKYREHIEKKEKNFKPLIHLNLSNTVHTILKEEGAINLDDFKVELANYDPNFLDFVLVVRDRSHRCTFVLDKENNLKEFKKEKLK